jgi:hypothetical protein
MEKRMIEIPEDGWGFGPAGDQARPGADTLLSGWPAPSNDGYLVVPGAEFWGMQPQTDDDPVLRADTMRERAGAVFKRQRAVGAFSRELDDLFTTVAEDADWSKGLEHFDRSLAELRRKHADGLEAQEDREAFERHAGQFGAMQRIGLKRALVERQQADALSQLDEQLAYYAGKAVTAPNDVFRSIAVDSGLQAIAELREAGYLFPEAAQRLETAFRGRLDDADIAAIVKADPGNALSLLDNRSLFPNADEAKRAALRQQVAGMTVKTATDAVPELGKALDYIGGELKRIGAPPPVPDSAPGKPSPHTPDKKGWHHYIEGPTPLGTEAEGLTAEMVKDALKRFAVPGQDPAKPVENNKRYEVFFPGTGRPVPKAGDVTTTIDDDGVSITNHTLEGHIFHPGRIIRQVHLHKGTWYVTTTGVGNNEAAFMDLVNQYGGPVVFRLVDDDMRQYIKGQIAK